MGILRNLSVTTASTTLIAAIALLLFAAPAGAQGPPTQGGGSGTGIDDHDDRTDFGQSGNWRETRTLTGFTVDGPLDGTFEQTVTGVVRTDRNFVTFHGTLEFTGKIDGCGDEEHTVILGINGRGEASPPVTEAKVRVIGASDGLHITGQGTVSQDVFALAYDVEYRCR